MCKRIVITTFATLSLAFAGCQRKAAGPVTPPVVVSPTPSPVAVLPPPFDPVAAFEGSPNESCDDDHLGLGTGLVEDGQVKEGLVELEKGVWCEPDDFDLRQAVGEAYLKAEDPRMAAGHLRVAAGLGGDFTTWQELGEAEFQVKDYDQSVTSLEKAIRLDKTSPRPWRLLARVYMEKEMWQESIDACEEAIARGSDSPWTYNNLGLSYLVLGKSDDAIRELEKAVSFAQEVSPQIWNNLGLAYEKKGELANAAAAYRASLAGAPTYVKAKINLARVTEVAKALGTPIGPEKAEVDFQSILQKTLRSPDEVTVPVK